MRLRSAVGLGLLVTMTHGQLVTVGSPAQASCVTHHVNVEATDSGFNGAYGNKGYIYVNTESALQNLSDTIGRTLFVANNSFTQDVEFGWAANLTTTDVVYQNPVVVSDYMIKSITQPPTVYPSLTLHFNTFVRFRIENVGGKGIFRYVVAGQSSPIGYSPAMNFNVGFVLTNSERYNNCDTLWTNMYDLQDQIVGGTSEQIWSDYSLLGCKADTSDDWYLQELNSTKIQVDQTVSGWGYNCAAE